ncbi:MAG: sodium-dependent transporter [Clostridiales bacterium]|nr:sodium-dependent transporter [Clostridiales bacterium]
MSKKRDTFTGTLGFILAAAGSAVGLGNIWRFPYLAAKDGGGLFLVVYLILAVTFGFTLLMSEVVIGRKTKQSALTAYGVINKKFGFLGGIATFVPFLIMPYYCVIGGWVLKYFIVFITGHGSEAATDGFFGDFISGEIEPVVMTVIFLAATVIVVIKGVNGGIERMSKVLMPVLLVLVIGISVFALTIRSGDRTGLQGLKILVVPNLQGKTVNDVFTVILDAMGQLFYSVSVAMGIMVTYGSYIKDDDNIVKGVNRIELFDTLVAFLAGVMVIPTVFVFAGTEGMEASGPGLMFQALPKTFSSMGIAGNIIGTLFFAMVLFAALTSSVSILEAVASGIIDKFKFSRTKAVLLEACAAVVLGVIVCFGYNFLYFEMPLPNGSTAQILDIMDYTSNNILMPILAIGTCILIGWIAKPDMVIAEATKNGEKFGRKTLFVVMVKYIAPVLLLLLLLKSLGIIDLLFAKKL